MGTAPLQLSEETQPHRYQRDASEGTLEQYLTDMNRDTQETYDLLMCQYAEIEGVTENLKTADNLKWTRQMNSIRNRVEEFVLSNFVYNCMQTNINYEKRGFGSAFHL